MTPFTKLKEIIEAEEKRTDFDHDRIIVTIEDHKFSIKIDNRLWSNQLSYYEAEDQIYCIFKGIELGRYNHD